jgi:uncharacterized protein YcaQ
MELSAADARRLAIAAQGLSSRPDGLLAMVRQLGVVQLDSVNVLARSHYPRRVRAARRVRPGRV